MNKTIDQENELIYEINRSLKYHVLYGYERDYFVYAWNNHYVYINIFNYTIKIDLINKCKIEFINSPQLDIVFFNDLKNDMSEFNTVVNFIESTIKAHAANVFRCEFENEDEVMLLDYNGEWVVDKYYNLSGDF